VLSIALSRALFVLAPLVALDPFLITVVSALSIHLL
jgi:hypothetical protein